MTIDGCGCCYRMRPEEEVRDYWLGYWDLWLWVWRVLSSMSTSPYSVSLYP